MHLADEVVEHHLDRVEVGDDAVLQGADRDDALRRLADHRLGFGAHAEGPPGAGVDGDDAGLGDDDAFAADVDQGVGGAQVDAEVATEKPEQRGQGADHAGGPPGAPWPAARPGARSAGDGRGAPGAEGGR